MVIMDQQDYTNKAQALQQDTNTYKIINKDPTSRLKKKLVKTLRHIKQTGGLNNIKYKQSYPISAVPPKFYGLPKIHKVGTPVRAIVSCRGSITYGVAKELAYIIKPLVHQPPTTLKTPNILFNNYNAKGWNQGRS